MEIKKYIDEDGLKLKMGTVYSADWIASEYSSISQRLTNSLFLPAGSYIISINTPYETSDERLTKQILITFSVDLQPGRVVYMKACYGTIVLLANFSKDTELYAITGSSTDSATWDLLDRGGISAIKIS